MKHGTIRAYYVRGCRCTECRKAARAYRASYRAAHASFREADKARSRAYYATHREHVQASNNAWHLMHVDEYRAYQLAYAADHREDKRTRAAAWYASNAQQARATMAAWRAAHPEAVRAIRHRRRARLAGVPAERFTLAEVAERDGWCCGVCGRKVDPKAKGRLGKSLDHIVPLALGGPHTMANAQLAHVGCNSAKGDRATIPAQMRLFG